MIIMIRNKTYFAIIMADGMKRKHMKGTREVTAKSHLCGFEIFKN